MTEKIAAAVRYEIMLWRLVWTLRRFFWRELALNVVMAAALGWFGMWAIRSWLNG